MLADLYLVTMATGRDHGRLTVGQTGEASNLDHEADPIACSCVATDLTA